MSSWIKEIDERLALQLWRNTNEGEHAVVVGEVKEEKTNKISKFHQTSNGRESYKEVHLSFHIE